MKIAYIILAHQHPEQLLRLVHQLNCEDVSFFVHIDKIMNDEAYSKVVARMCSHQNIFFLSRLKCFEGAFSVFNLVEATIEGMKRILDSKTPFDYIVLLSGQDYPIKPNGHIKDFLQLNKGKSFMEYNPMPYLGWNNGGMDRFPEGRKFPSELPLFGGSQWWCLTRECVEYACDFIRKNTEYTDYFKYVRVSNEIFFHTIILNSIFKDSVINNNLEHIDWHRPEPPYPAILSADDFEELYDSPRLFARKFDITKDSEILDMIDQKIHGISVRDEVQV